MNPLVFLMKRRDSLKASAETSQHPEEKCILMIQLSELEATILEWATIERRTCQLPADMGQILPQHEITKAIEAMLR